MPTKMSYQIFSTLFAALLVFAAASNAFAQPAPKDDKDKVADPEDVSLDVKDGLFLKATYYAGPKLKQTVPIIILHDQKSSRAEFETLAKHLQKEGKHSVFVPDLRGYGESNRYRAPNGDVKTIDPKKLTPANHEQIVTVDYPAIKAWLREKNNNAELNLSQICVIGVGSMGSALAMNVAFYDWTRPQLIGFKTGEDVRALVLVSPTDSFGPLSFTKPLQHPAVGGPLVSKMVIGGKKDTDLAKLKKLLEARHGKQPTDVEDRKKSQNLFFYELATSVTGLKLFDPSFDLGMDTKLLGFITFRLTNKYEEYPWQDRPSPR